MLQFRDHMKLEKKEDLVLLRWRKEILMEVNMEKKLEHTEGNVFQRLSHIYTATKPRQYCGCQELHADPSLI